MQINLKIVAEIKTTLLKLHLSVFCFFLATRAHVKPGGPWKRTDCRAVKASKVATLAFKPVNPDIAAWPFQRLFQNKRRGGGEKKVSSTTLLCFT